jgi:hypothetical protein
VRIDRLWWETYLCTGDLQHLEAVGVCRKIITNNGMFAADHHVAEAAGRLVRHGEEHRELPPKP